MKNLLIIVGLTIFSSTYSSELKPEIVENNHFQTKTIKGYVVVQGAFKEMNLTIQKSQYGYILQKWEMVEPIDYRNSWGHGGNASLTPLNSQNQFAIKYNFTHVVNTTYGNAYLILNQ
jgi:hypothetical protein